MSNVNQKPLLVVLSGAGMSAESGFATFRDRGGLWETHPVERVATPEGWAKDPDFVNEFYNSLRRQLLAAHPNAGHDRLAALERDFEVVVITQNVDDLHERAGSSRVVHLHGELLLGCSSDAPNDPRWRVQLPTSDPEIHPGQRAGDGSLLRPFIVWFGEAVPLIEDAAQWVARADAFAIIGSSLAVYPAAGLVRHCRADIPILLIDPNEVAVPGHRAVEVIAQPATQGVATLAAHLHALFPAPQSQAE